MENARGKGINYNNRFFRGVSNSDNGEVSGDTIFLYSQEGSALSGTYGGGVIARGHLTGTVNADGSLDFLYHHINVDGEAMAGQCHSVPRLEADGRLVLEESWQWLTGDRSAGTSAVAEAAPEELPEYGSWLSPLHAGVIAALRSQYSATLATLEQAISFFPGPRWDEDHPDGPACRAVFHTLFFTDVYLHAGPHGLRSQRFHIDHPELFQDYEELEDREPSNHYRRDLCERYLQHCREKMEDTLGASTEAELVADSGFPRRNLSRLALHIYNIRHIQHHAAQLGLRNQLSGGAPLTWQSR